MTGARAVADEAPHVPGGLPCDVPRYRTPSTAGAPAADMSGTISSTLTLVGRFDPGAVAHFVSPGSDVVLDLTSTERNPDR